VNLLLGLQLGNTVLFTTAPDPLSYEHLREEKDEDPDFHPPNLAKVPKETKDLLAYTSAWTQWPDYHRV
jgi:hypothetical protein